MMRLTASSRLCWLAEPLAMGCLSVFPRQPAAGQSSRETSSCAYCQSSTCVPVDHMAGLTTKKSVLWPNKTARRGSALTHSDHLSRRLTKIHARLQPVLPTYGERALRCRGPEQARHSVDRLRSALAGLGKHRGGCTALALRGGQFAAEHLRMAELWAPMGPIPSTPARCRAARGALAHLTSTRRPSKARRGS